MKSREKSAAKVLITLATITAVVSASRELSVLLPYATILALGAAFCLRIPMRLLASRMALAAPFFVLIGLSRAFGGQGYEDTMMLVYKSSFSMIALAILSSTTGFGEMIEGLRHLGLPKTIAQVLCLQQRYFSILTDEIGRMSTARASRTVMDEGIVRRIASSGNLIGVLFVRSFERYERVYDAMASRGHSNE